MSNETAVAPLIPGISNISSVGSKPTCRSGRSVLTTTGYASLSPPKQPLRSGDGERLQSPLGMSVGYNPITNPIPNFSQNPYILRQKQLAMSIRGNSPPPTSTADKIQEEA